MTSREFAETFSNIKVGCVVELIAIQPCYNSNKTTKMFLTGIVNSKTLKEDEDECSLEVNGNVIKVANIVTIVDVYEILED